MGRSSSDSDSPSTISSIHGGPENLGHLPGET
jgi:hypothetical protein